MRLGRLSAPYRALFEVVRQERTHRLRHYGAGAAPRQRPIDDALRPVLLVPPLMVSSEVYDISPELSAVQQLLDAGLDVWLTDFGAPEREEGGLNRTLDDHIRAVSECIDEIVRATGKPVHLAGYSQGGMFCYQVAAFRESRDIASLVTFGSPVDIRRNLPVSTRIAERVIAAARTTLEKPIEAIDGLPGFLTATGFKLLSVRKEVQQLVEFVASLHDREKLEARESRRRFLAGEGFVWWPGPAFRTFVDEFIVSNRMASGGFVVEGRTVTLADIRAPILYFVGTKDEIARPASVRAIERAAPQADTYEVDVRAGHFGLVVGSTAMRSTWPTVIEWVRWHDGGGALPTLLEHADEAPPSRVVEDLDDEDFDEVPLDVELFYDVATSALDAVAKRFENAGRELGELIDNLRWQVPRLQKLRSVGPETRIGMGLALAEQARAIPDHTFFLWKGRAFSYRDADRRVNAIVRGLFHSGVRPGDKVGVLMEARPSYLSIVTALNRMGAVAVLLSPQSSRVSLEEAVRLAEMQHVIVDPDNAELGRRAFTGTVLCLGGGPPGTPGRAPMADGIVDMEAIDPEQVVLPEDFVPDQARAADLAMIIFTAGRAEQPRPARITNRRWAFSALGAAAACALTSNDTVYCGLPLHHAAGMLVSVGGALVGGSRLALGRARPGGVDPATFVRDVHRYGASVVFYAGEMLRPLVDGPPGPLDASLPVRLFAGSGMRADLWNRLRERYPRAQVLDFYASTEGNAVLANTRGRKVGSLGRPLPGSADLSLLAWDFERDAFARDERGTVMLAREGDPGVLVARIDSAHPMASFDGYEGDTDGAQRILRGLFEPGDAWFVTGDLLRRDGDGDYWFVDRLADVVRAPHGPIFTHEVEDKLLAATRLGGAAVLAKTPNSTELAALVVGAPPTNDDAGSAALRTFSAQIADSLPAAFRPRLVRWVEGLPLTDGFRPRKTNLRRDLLALDGRTFVLDRDGYRALRPGDVASHEPKVS